MSMMEEKLQAIEKAKEILNVKEEILKEGIELLLGEKEIFIENLKAKDGENIRAVYLWGYRLAEFRIAKMLNEIKQTPKTHKKIYPDACIYYAQKILGIKLAEKPKEAVKSAITEKVTIITGCPGTGKTTITKTILKIFSLATEKILLATPTGRAAKRMTESTGKEAKTIHRLLEYSPMEGKFKRNEENPFDCDVIIIDEVSMIDNLLMYHLLKAIPKNSAVILVGDINQLPSVGAGNVLKDVINSGVFPVTELNEIFRQEKTSEIIINAHKIINGKIPEVENNAGGDFYFIEEGDTEKIGKKIIDIVKVRIPNKFGLDAVKDVQVLTPMNKGIIGTNGLNELLQEALNPNGFEINRGGRKFRIGDKVMQIRNNYNKNVYNGDIGNIRDIETESQTIKVLIDGNEINYEYEELDELVLAYAVSIHKSQGSEYPAVVMPLSMSHYMMLQRNLVYTGITRGKKVVVIIGSKKAMRVSVNNNKVVERNTWLEQRIRDFKF